MSIKGNLLVVKRTGELYSTAVAKPLIIDGNKNSVIVNSFEKLLYLKLKEKVSKAILTVTLAVNCGLPGHGQVTSKTTFVFLISR